MDLHPRLIGFDTATAVTAIAVGFFLLIAVVVLARLIFRKDQPPAAKRFRVGVFIERDREHKDEPPPT